MNFKLSFLALSLILIGAGASATVDSIVGTYTKVSGVRIFQSQETCRAMQGEFMPDDGACIIRSEGGNSITISKSPRIQDRLLVQVATLYGSVHQSSFEGVVAKTGSRQLLVVEAESDTEKPLRQPCILVVRIEANKASVSPVGKYCDKGLHIEDAKKN